MQKKCGLGGMDHAQCLFDASDAGLTGDIQKVCGWRALDAGGAPSPPKRNKAPAAVKQRGPCLSISPRGRYLTSTIVRVIVLFGATRR